MRMFLVEKGKFVIVRNESDISVVFGSFEEFYKYCPVNEFSIDLTGKYHLDYEPVRGIYYDSTDTNISMDNAPVTVFENIIDNVIDIKERMSDPYYGITLEDAKAYKINEAKSHANILITNKWPIYTQININAGIPGCGNKTDKDNDVISVRNTCNTAESAISSLTSVVDVEAYIINWPTI